MTCLLFFLLTIVSLVHCDITKVQCTNYCQNWMNTGRASLPFLSVNDPPMPTPNPITRDAIGRPISTEWSYEYGQPTKGGSLVQRYMKLLISQSVDDICSDMTIAQLSRQDYGYDIDAGHIVQSAAKAGVWVNGNPLNFFPQHIRSNRSPGCWRRIETAAQTIWRKLCPQILLNVHQTFEYGTDRFIPIGGNYQVTTTDATCLGKIQQAQDYQNLLLPSGNGIGIRWFNSAVDAQPSLANCPAIPALFKKKQKAPVRRSRQPRGPKKRRSAPPRTIKTRSMTK